MLGFYDSPEDYVAGNLQGSLFEHVDEEEPFEGDMNKQYNADIIDEEYSEVRILYKTRRSILGSVCPTM